MSKYNTSEVLGIRYDVWVGGVQLKGVKRMCVTSIEVKETVEGANSATLKIADPDFLFINDNIFSSETTINLSIGWSNSTYLVHFDGYIATVDIDFPSDGIPIITITCIDCTHAMNKEKKNNTFSKMTSAEVVTQIMQNYGFEVVVEEDYEFKKQETITQSQQTDIEFIQKLASEEVYPFSARLMGTKFYYVKKGHLADEVMTLTYKKFPHDIISFSPKITKEDATNKDQTTISADNKMVTKTASKSSNKGSSKKSSSSSSKGGEMTYNPATSKWSSSSSSSSRSSTPKRYIKNE